MNSLNLRKIAIIPSYQDTDSLLKLLKKFRKGSVDEACIIIDCVTEIESKLIERTVERHEIPVHKIVNESRKGVGFAIRRGLQYALSRNYEVAIIMAGNNKDDPREIPRFLKPILEEDCDYVQGSRFLPGGKAVRNPLLRQVFSRIFPFFWTLLTNVRCTDVTNGFRAYRLSILHDKRININQGWLDDYQLEYYVHYKVLTLGYKTKEVAVSKTYPFRHKGGYSRISPLRDWWKIIAPLIYLKLGARN